MVSDPIHAIQVMTSLSHNGKPGSHLKFLMIPSPQDSTVYMHAQQSPWWHADITSAHALFICVINVLFMSWSNSLIISHAEFFIIIFGIIYLLVIDTIYDSRSMFLFVKCSVWTQLGFTLFIWLSVSSINNTSSGCKLYFCNI